MDRNLRASDVWMILHVIVTSSRGSRHSRCYFSSMGRFPSISYAVFKFPLFIGISGNFDKPQIGKKGYLWRDRNVGAFSHFYHRSAIHRICTGRGEMHISYFSVNFTRIQYKSTKLIAVEAPKCIRSRSISRIKALRLKVDSKAEQRQKKKCKITQQIPDAE